MSTVATTRPNLTALSTLPVNERCVSPVDIVSQLTATSLAATTTATAAPSFALFRHTMHPDNLLLQKHGVTSPRLSVVNAILKPDVSVKRHSAVTMSSQEISGDLELNHKQQHEDPETDHVMIDDDDDDGEDDDDEDVEDNGNDVLDADPRRSKLALSRNSKHVEVCDEVEDDVDEDVLDEHDAVSLCCSEDSELSVGQEDPLEGGGRPENKLLTQQTRRLLAVSDMMSLCHPSAFSNVTAVTNNTAEVIDARSSASTEDEPQATQPPRPAPLVMDPFTMAASALRMPVPIVPRPSTTQLQEELLRKSHLYAEELMKQQMQLMAAARASAFTLRQPAALTSATDAKLGFRQQQQTHSALVQPKLSEIPNFSGIHSHLSAISKMSQLSAAAAAAAAAATVAQQQQPQALGGSYNASTDALAKLTAFGMGQTQMATTSASNLNQLQAQMQAHLPFMNNNLNEPALKFSIDNILKADFGRRITEPLKRGSGSGINGANGQRAGRAAHMQRNKQKNCPPSSTSTTTTPMDLTSQMTAAAAAIATSVTSTASNFSSTLANICTNSNDSSSTVVSSNYGNSDALKSPSSLTGANSTCSVSPAPAGVGGGGGGDGGGKSFNEADGGGGGGGGCGSSSGSSTTSSNGGGTGASGNGPIVWPAWVYCTRYSDRPSSGPRARKPKKPASEKGASPSAASAAEDKRPRTAFSGSQLARLKHEFTENRYLTEKRRQQLSSELGLNEAQIKIWFQNKRAKLKKSSGTKNPLALQLMAQGLYNHSTVPLTREEEELQELQERENAASTGTVSS